MAAVTVTRYRSVVVGSRRMLQYTINIANSGDTLQVPLRIVEDISTNNFAMQNAVPTASSGGNSIAFTTSGAITGLLLSTTGL